MSEFDLGFGGFRGVEESDISSNTDNQTGYTILKEFAAAASKFNQISALEILDYYDSNFHPFDANSFLESLGLAASSAGISTGTPWFSTGTKDIMTKLANAGKGKIPANPNSFFASLTSGLMPSEWADAFEKGLTAVASVSQPIIDRTVQLAEDTGSAVFETAEATVGIARMLPYFMYGGVALIAWSLWKNRDHAAESAYAGAKTVASAATGGLLNLGGAITSAAVKKVSANPRKRKKRK